MIRFRKPVGKWIYHDINYTPIIRDSFLLYFRSPKGGCFAISDDLSSSKFTLLPLEPLLSVVSNDSALVSRSYFSGGTYFTYLNNLNLHVNLFYIIERHQIRCSRGHPSSIVVLVSKPVTPAAVLCVQFLNFQFSAVSFSFCIPYYFRTSSCRYTEKKKQKQSTLILRYLDIFISFYLFLFVFF